MLLTNVVFIHYSSKDFRQKYAFDELTDTVKEIHEGDKNVKVCILLRDAGKTKQVARADFPPEFKKIGLYIDALIQVKDMKTVANQKKL